MTRHSPLAAALAIASLAAATASLAVASEEPQPPAGTTQPPAVASPQAAAVSPSSRADALALVAPGTSVRLASRLIDGRISGRVLRADGHSLELLPKRGAAVRVPYGTLTSLDVSFGSRRHVREGLLAGLAFGVVMGVTADVDEDACDWNDETYCSRREAVGVSVLGGALLGAGIGALVKTDRWQAVAVDELRVGLAPLRGRGAGLALALSW